MNLHLKTYTSNSYFGLAAEVVAAQVREATR